MMPDAPRPEACVQERKHIKNYMPLTRRHGALQKLQKGQYIDISADIQEDEEVPWTNTPWDMQADISNTVTPEKKKTTMTNPYKDTQWHQAQQQQHVSKLQHGGITRMQSEMTNWEASIQKTCWNIYAIVTSAARKGCKDVLEKLEQHERPPRESILRMRWILEYCLDENENRTPKPCIVIFWDTLIWTTRIDR